MLKMSRIKNGLIGRSPGEHMGRGSRNVTRNFGTYRPPG
jgi:hypothetical protein